MTGEQAVAKLPPSIRIGPFDFRIEKWEPCAAERAHRYGECLTTEQVIRIRSDMSSPEKAADTLLHEVSHAIWWVHGIEDSDLEERTVNLSSTGWVSAYRSNPWLLGWLAECLT